MAWQSLGEVGFLPTLKPQYPQRHSGQSPCSQLLVRPGGLLLFELRITLIILVWGSREYLILLKVSTRLTGRDTHLEQHLETATLRHTKPHLGII